MPTNRLVLGQWNALCDVCGFKHKSGELRKRWDGLMVCDKDWEQRHPQDLLRVKSEKIAPPWVRTDPPPVYVTVCNIWQSSPYADLAAADCAHADVGTPNLTYAFLYPMYLESLVTNG